MPFVSQPLEKCGGCNQTVYQTEKVMLEFGDATKEKKPYHKACVRCKQCNKALSITEYVSLDGKIYCKPHYKQLFATKGNYDESFGNEKSSKWTPQVVTEKQSFIPSTAEEGSIKKERNETSEATVAKIKKFQEEGQSEKCTSCGKTVYLAEKLVLEDRTMKRLFHKLCFKCSNCEIQLDLRTGGFSGGKVYCKNHLKEVSTENTPSEKWKATPVIGNASFVPEVKEEKGIEKSETPEHIAAKFRSMSVSEKCKICSKTVYATERIIIEELKQQSVYHKLCLKCSHCGLKLDISTYGSSGGVIFCKPHLKQFGKPEQQKGSAAFFLSPLATTDPDYASNRYESQPEESSREESPNSRRTNETTLEQPTHVEEEQAPIEVNPPLEDSSKLKSSGDDVPLNDEEDRRRKREERQRLREEEERKFEEEKKKREKEREERRKQREEENRREEEEMERKAAERKKEREEKKRQLEEEEAQERRKKSESRQD